MIHFGSFGCRLCPDAWREHRGLEKRWGERIRLGFRHHFPDTALGPFEDALRAECSGRQGALDRFAAWRNDAAREGPPSAAPDVAAWGLDAAAFQRCVADPLTAVRVLADVDEARRLGFGEAVPSWVVGRRPRRGFQGAAILDETVASEIAHAAGPR